MPKGSPELVENRKKEILKACAQLYEDKGFSGINIKEISTATTCSRPTIYNYYETKEEILLDLLTREYQGWCLELAEVEKEVSDLTLEQLADRLATPLSQRPILLRILNMNLYDIEINSRTERLAEFKKLYFQTTVLLGKIYLGYKQETTVQMGQCFAESFSAYLFGVYPFAFHTEKQKQAMKLAGIPFEEPSLYEMLYRMLLKLLG